MNKLIFALFLMMSTSAFSLCEKADALYPRNVASAVKEYQKCALMENDDISQLRLAQIYQKGAKNVQVNEMQMLLFYHLAADNGNAEAQTKLAKLLIEMDQDPVKREIVSSYLSKIEATFKGEDLEIKKGIFHPYILLMLAAEPVDQKWYYPSYTKSYLEAALLLKDYEIDEQKKRLLLYKGSKWKQAKMKETAQDVLSYAEYQKFYQTLYPLRGKPDQFLRQQAINNLKEKVKQYLK